MPRILVRLKHWTALTSTISMSDRSPPARQRAKFNGVANPSNLTVENTIEQSAPNAMEIAASSASGSFGFAGYSPPGFLDHTLQLSIELGPDFVLPSGDYVVLAQTQSVQPTSDQMGKVALVLTGGNLALHLDYVDSSGIQKTFWPSGTPLTYGAWHTIQVQDTVGSGTGGSLSLSLDGHLIGDLDGLDTGSSGVGYFAVGDEFNSQDVRIAGHLYIDNISTSTIVASTPTPSATAAPTATTQPSPSPSPSATGVPTGQVAINFDSQSTGAVRTGSGANKFTGVSGEANLYVQNSIASSQPNALSISSTQTGQSFGFVSYPSGYLSHTLQFKLRLGSDFTLPSNDYMVLAQTQSGNGSTNAGKVDVIVTGGALALHVDYFDSSGNQHTIYSSASLPSGSWATLALTDTVGAGTSGSVTLSLNGVSIATQSGIDTGSAPVTYFAVGDEYSTTDSRIAGHLYVDDIVGGLTS